MPKTEQQVPPSLAKLHDEVDVWTVLGAPLQQVIQKMIREAYDIGTDEGYDAGFEAGESHAG